MPISNGPFHTRDNLIYTQNVQMFAFRRVIPMVHTTQPQVSTRLRLVDQVSAVRRALGESGVHVHDMSRAGTLESLIGTESLEADGSGPARPVTITRIESTRIESRAVTMALPGSTQFRYFLDGSQKSVPVFRIGLVPIVSAVLVAGILHRAHNCRPCVVEGGLDVQQTWVVPGETRVPAIDSLARELQRRGYPVVDPFCDSNGFPREDYASLTGNYGQALTRAYAAASKVREQLEASLAFRWYTEVHPLDPDAWMVIDGRLPQGYPNAVGLVKSLDTQLLANDEAITLFDLPPGHRTTAFRYGSSDPDYDESRGKTMWYVRLWPAQGMDARHALVRVEAANAVSSTEQIDEITSWILAERLPRATDDPRWPTLLYPISYLERILKRHLADITAGWPSA